MKNKAYDLIFLGLARNVTNTILNFFESIEKISKKNFNILVIIGENSSKDGSRKLLKKYENENYDFILLDTDKLSQIKNRILRLGEGRQYLKNFIKENNLTSKFISIVDLDEVIIDGINTNDYVLSLKKLSDNSSKWFGISSKSDPYYYDLLPLIIKDYFEFDIYKLQTEASLDFYSRRKKYIYDFQKKITKMRDVNTVSSHNGLTTYLFKDYILGNYISDDQKIRSEHINLNYNIYKKTGKYLRMSSTVKLRTPNEHMPLKLDQFLKRIIFKKIKLSN